MVALAEGDIDAVARNFKEASRLARGHFPGDIGLMSTLDVCWAEYYWELGNSALAARHMEKVSVTLNNREAWFDVYMAAYRVRVGLLIEEQNSQLFDQFLATALDHAREEDLPLLESYLLLLQACGLFQLERLQEGLRVYQQWLDRQFVASLHWREQELSFLVGALAARAQGLQSQVAQPLSDLAELARCQGNNRNRAYALSWLLRLGNPQQHQATLQLAGKELLAMQSVWPGTRVVAMLGEVVDNIPQLEPLSTAIGDLKKVEEAASPVFSKRERQVLDELAQGLADKEIARKLDISANTVRFHLKNIYAKTHARNRIEALKNAAALTT